MSAAKTKRAGFSGDHPLIGVIVAIFLLLGVGGSFGLSAFGLWYLAGTMGVDGIWRLLLLFVIDGLIIGATGSILLLRGRGESTVFLWFVVVLFTGISAWANFTSHQMQGQDVASAAMGAFMPLALLIATEVALIALVRRTGEAPERKPRRTAKRTAPAAVAPVEVTAPATPARAPRPSAPRAPRASNAGAVRATDYPFDEIMSLSEEELFSEFDALASNPATSQKGSAESPRFSAVAWHLVEAHGHRMSDLARRAGHADAARIKDRVRRVREHAPVAA